MAAASCTKDIGVRLYIFLVFRLFRLELSNCDVDAVSVEPFVHIVCLS
jgi:hypothetical protein